MTIEVADIAGELIRSWRAHGISLGDTDAIITCTALNQELVMVTTSAKHFPMPDLVVYKADENGK